MNRYLVIVFSVFLMVGTLADSVRSVDLNDYEYYEPEKNDFVRLQVLNNKVTAFRSQNPSAPIDLGVEEQVLAQDEDGDVGAILTNDRFLAVSSGSVSWLSKSLYTGESESARLMVGTEIALLVTDRRIIGFSAQGNTLVEFALSVGDTVEASDVGQSVGVVVLPERAVGFSADTNEFSTVRFDYGGAFRSMEVAAGVALVKTDNKIYAYRAGSGTWSTQTIPPNQ